MRRRAPGVRHRVFIVAAAATDALPAVIAVAGAVTRDNTTAFMTFAMWAFWAWMVTVLPRMACYFFRWTGLPRVGIAAGAGVAALFIWGATAGRTTIRVNRTEVCSERLPAGLDGFRIAQITDTHLGTVVRPEAELRRLVDSVNSLRPDLIVFCGDLVNIRSSELDARARQLLGGLRAPYGVVSVTGNHDAGLYIKDTVAQSPAASLAEVIARQRAMGWNVLEDTTVYLRRGGDSISLTGLSFDPALRHMRHDPDLPSRSRGLTASRSVSAIPSSRNMRSTSAPPSTIRRSMPRFSSSVTMYLAVIASLVEMTVAIFCNPVISPGENT